MSSGAVQDLHGYKQIVLCLSWGEAWRFMFSMHLSCSLFSLILWQIILMIFKCVKYRLVSSEQNCSWKVFWILSPSAADILIINSPVNKQFCASVRQKEGGTDLKPRETGFPEALNERVILQICLVHSRKEISFFFFFSPKENFL